MENASNEGFPTKLLTVPIGWLAEKLRGDSVGIWALAAYVAAIVIVLTGAFLVFLGVIALILRFLF